jgi:hypothetical protein
LSSRPFLFLKKISKELKIIKVCFLLFPIIGEDTPKESLRRWNRVYKLKGLDGLVESRGKSSGGGRPKTKDLTDADKIKRLETEVAYLKAENDFLAKLRASKKR